MVCEGCGNIKNRLVYNKFYQVPVVVPWSVWRDKNATLDSYDSSFCGWSMVWIFPMCVTCNGKES